MRKEEKSFFSFGKFELLVAKEKLIDVFLLSASSGHDKKKAFFVA